MSFPKRCCKKLGYSSQKSIDKKKILQVDLNKKFTAPVFDLTESYSLAINTILVTMFFCSGMPILLGFAALFFMFKYASDKFLLLRYNSKPPAFDEKIALKVADILPLALYMHLGVASIIYGV